MSRADYLRSRFRLAPGAGVLFTLFLLAFALSHQDSGFAQDAGGAFGIRRSKIAEKYDLDPPVPDELLGVVVDENDKSVAGATVYLRPHGDWNDSRLRQTRTDDLGQFVFPRVEVGEYLLAAISGARATRTQYRKWLDVTFTSDLSREPIVAVLKPAGQVTIRVVDAETKEPLPGAKIQLGYWDLPRDRVADKNGESVAEGLPLKSYEFSATASGYAKKTIGTSVKSTPETTVVLELEPGAVIVGTARDPDGNPIGRPRPHLRDPTDSGMFFDFTQGGNDGVFRFDHAPIGMSILLDFDAKGFIEPKTIIRPLRAGETRRVDVTLKPVPRGSAVTGVVTNENGQPVVGATIEIEWQDDRIAYTDDEGRFRIDDVDPRRDAVIVRAAGYAARVARFTKGTREKPGEVKVELELGNRIHARVVDEQGKPISGAYVDFPADYSYSSRERVRTDASGEFRSDVVPAGAKFRIYASGYSDQDRAELPLNGDDVVEVVLAPEGLIKGVAIDDETGAPIPTFNVRMTFSPERKTGDPSGGIDTDWDSPGRMYNSAEGRFDIDDLVIGQPMIVTVEAEGYRPAVIRRIEAVRPDDQSRKEFRLTRLDPESLITVAGVISTAEGKPVSGAEVRLIARLGGTDQHHTPLNWDRIKGELQIDDQVPQMLRGVTDEQGRFEFNGVYSDCVVEVAYWGVGVAAGRLQHIEKMKPEKRTSLAIKSTTPGRLTVTLAAEAFKSASSLGLTSTRDPGLSQNRWNPAADGIWQIDDIIPGEYRLVIARREYSKDHPSAFQSVTIHEQILEFAVGEEKVLRLDNSTPPESKYRLLQKNPAAKVGQNSHAEKYSE